MMPLFGITWAYWLLRWTKTLISSVDASCLPATAVTPERVVWHIGRCLRPR